MTKQFRDRIDSRNDSTTQQHINAQQWRETLKTAEYRALGNCCKDCKNAHRQQFTLFCTKKKFKPVNQFSICHLYTMHGESSIQKQGGLTTAPVPCNMQTLSQRETFKSISNRNNPERKTNV